VLAAAIYRRHFFVEVAAVDFGNNIPNREQQPEVRVGGFPGPFSN
jgi:hypothetical protein